MKLWWNVAMPALVAGVMAAGAPTPASAQGAIKMDGSSTVFPIAEALAEEYPDLEARQGPCDGRA